MKLFLKILTLLTVLGMIAPQYAIAQEAPAQYEGQIMEVKDNTEQGQTYVVIITTGDKKGEKVEIIQDLTVSDQAISYKKGDTVFLLAIYDSFYITDYKRTKPLMWLFFIFVAAVLIISKKWGIASLAGMVYSFVVIFKFILPLLLKGYNPLGVAIIGALLIAPVTFYVSHGINKKTTVALLSTIASLLVTGIIASITINIARLTGFGSDDALFLQVAKEGTVNVKGIFLAGIIIGTLGILDDVTVSQAAVVYQLKTSIRGISSVDLYKKAMEVGHDHIASMVNTLVLVYTGAALPLMLLFTNSAKSLTEAINSEIIADEIVRTLAGSIGLILAVPISTIMAVALIKAGYEK